MLVLVVDDEADVRCLLKRILLCHGFTVVEAHDGLTALYKVRQMRGNISALVTEIDMDGLNGIILARCVASEFPAIPILFVSSAAPESAQDVPHSAFLAKPFKMAKLVEAVRRVVQRPAVKSQSAGC
jgi:CheY-like chemotaxis protein